MDNSIIQLMHSITGVGSTGADPVEMKKMRTGEITITLDLGELGEVDFEVSYSYICDSGDRWTPAYTEIDMDIYSMKPGLVVYEKALSKDIVDRIHTRVLEDVSAQIEDAKQYKADAENDRFMLYREVE